MSLANTIIDAPSDRSRRARSSSARRLRAGARNVVHELIRTIVSTPATARMANALYRRSSPDARERFQRRFAKIFRDRRPRAGESGRWTVSFAGRPVVHPLVPERMWLDWDIAISTLGHEPNVKRTYETLLRSADRPELFIDVGANYGTHSLIFSVHGVETLTFEPNASCHEYFREICALNGVTPRLEGVALGEVAGEVTLSYPKGETWLGSINAGTVAELEQGAKLERVQVPVRPLDDYLDIAAGRRVVVKIDAEGHELPILRGAKRMLDEVRPHVLFESWAKASEERRALWDLFSSAGYRIARLPLVSDEAPALLRESEFRAEGANDFIAIPA